MTGSWTCQQLEKFGFAHNLHAQQSRVLNLASGHRMAASASQQYGGLQAYGSSDRVVCVRQVVICGDKSVTTEVQLAAPSDRGEAAGKRVEILGGGGGGGNGMVIAWGWGSDRAQSPRASEVPPSVTLRVGAAEKKASQGQGGADA